MGAGTVITDIAREMSAVMTQPQALTVDTGFEQWLVECNADLSSGANIELIRLRYPGDDRRWHGVCYG